MPKDPYKYFRVEACDLVEGMSQSVLELEKSGPSKEIISKLLRFAHTLKGAARVVKQLEISQNSHTIEDILAPYREGKQAVQRENIKEILQLLDAINTQINSLQKPEVQSTLAPSASASAKTQVKTDEGFESIRINVADMDEVLEGLNNNAAHLQALRSYNSVFLDTLQFINSLLPKISALKPNLPELVKLEDFQPVLAQSARNYLSNLDQAQRSMQEAREKTSALRMLPAESIFQALERSVIDAAESTKKRVQFETTGGDTRLDTHVLRALKNALLHVVRNAVAHGIESEAERLAFGKDLVGRVHLHVERRGSQIAFVCKDDGKGVNLEEVRKVLIQRSAISEEDAKNLNVERAIELILKGGISTTTAPTELSGRGVGLDAVNNTIIGLNGTLKMHSEPMKGTTVDICVPISIESMKVLNVSVMSKPISIPFDSVRQTLRAGEEQIAHHADGDALVFEGRAIPIVSLTRILGADLTHKAKTVLTLLVLVDGQSSIALLVDGIVGVDEVITRPLPSILGKVPLIHGAFFDPDGNPQLILETQALIQLASRKQESPKVFQTKKNRILVIDDSLTTRMLEQTILETAGYTVDIATSGEEAIEKARKTDYTLFIVDVEMPGMNGFEFIERTRADPKFKTIPAILVTSLADAEHRKKGKDAGASAHIMKSEFDERYFLHTIRQLIG